MRTGRMGLSLLFLGLACGITPHNTAFAGADTEQDSLLLRCAMGIGAEKYTFDMDIASHPHCDPRAPIYPRSFAIAADGTIFIAQAEYKGIVRILIFGEEGTHRVTFLPLAKTPVITDMVVDADKKVALVAGVEAQHIIAFDVQNMRESAIGPQGVVEGDALRNPLPEENKYPCIAGVHYVAPGRLRIIGGPDDSGVQTMDEFDWKTGTFTAKGAPIPEEYKSRKKAIEQVRATLNEDGIKDIVDVERGPGGAFYYMTVTEAKLEIRKVIARESEASHKEQEPQNPRQN